MPSISRLRSTAPVVCFWAYAAFLAAATHAPADEVSFLVRAVDSGVVEPDKLIHVAAYAVLGLLAAVLLTAGSGCSTLLTAAYVLMPEDTPAEFAGLKGKHVAVVCKPIIELEFADAGSGRQLASVVGSLLQQNVRKARVIDQQEVARWIDEHAWVDYPTVGKALDADMVVGIDLEEFRLHEGTTLYRGRATIHVRVFDVAAGKVVFEIVGVPEELAREAFRLAAAKLPLRTTFVARQIGA